MINAMSASLAGAAHLQKFQALADENRLRILETLADGEHCVCELQASLEMGQSLLSHHLRTLREAGLVTDRREGRWVHYSLSAIALLELSQCLQSLGSGEAAIRPTSTTTDIP